MGMRQNSTFVERGKTYPSGTDTHLLGAKMLFDNRDYTNPQLAPLRDGGEVECTFVKNASGGALLPGLGIKFAVAADTDFGVNIAGTTGAGDIPDGIVDEFLPAAGVANGDYFLMVTKGPVKVQSDGTGTISRGAVIVTAASGQFVTQTAAPANTTAAMVQVNSKAGRARTAATNVAGTIFTLDFGKN